MAKGEDINEVHCQADRELFQAQISLLEYSRHRQTPSHHTINQHEAKHNKTIL